MFVAGRGFQPPTIGSPSQGVMLLVAAPARSTGWAAAGFSAATAANIGTATQASKAVAGIHDAVMAFPQ